MEINSLAGYFLKFQISFWSFLNRHHHTTANASTPNTDAKPTTQRRQHILTHTYTYLHILTQPNTTNTQPNTTLISSTGTGPLHSKWHEACTVIPGQLFLCMTRTLSPNRKWTESPRTLTLRQVRALLTERADWKSDHCYCY